MNYLIRVKYVVAINDENCRCEPCRIVVDNASYGSGVIKKLFYPLDPIILNRNDIIEDGHVINRDKLLKSVPIYRCESMGIGNRINVVSIKVVPNWIAICQIPSHGGNPNIIPKLFP